MPRKNRLDMLSILQEHGAFLDGHFCLPSGMHSQLYIQACALMGQAHIAQKIAKAMSDKFTKPVDVVLAPSAESSVIAHEVARQRRGVRAMFAEQSEEGEQLALKRNFIIKPGEAVLIVDDVAVSGRKIESAISLVRRMGGRVIGVSVVVDRSSGVFELNVPLRALVSYPLKSYAPHQCPLCKSNIPLTNKEENQ